MDKRIKLTRGTKETLKGQNLKDALKQISKALDNSKIYKRAEIGTLGEVYHSQSWRRTKALPITTMHIVRFLKR